jgi:hypothetical protein
MGSMGQVNRSFGVEKSSTGLLNEDSPGVREFDYASLFPNKQVKPMVIFKFGDLFAERRLADPQQLSGSREVQFFSKDHDGLQVTHVNVGEHCSEPRPRIW